MNLQQAFDISRGDVVAFVGAGGKTSLLVGMGYELAEEGWRVLATTSASFRRDQLALFPRALPYDSEAGHISQALSEDGFVLLYDEVRDGRVSGPAPEWTRHVLDSVDSDVLLVEADEADGMPFKAPLPSQPWIPPETSLVVPVASLDALGAPLDDENVYNPQAMVDRFGFVENSPVKSPWLAQVLRDEELGLKNVPPGARVVIFINRTPERGYLRGRARMIARLSLQSPRVHAVALGSVRAAEPVHELQRTVGAIVLATARSLDSLTPRARNARKGKQTVITQIGEQLIRSRIENIRVVAGANATGLRALLKPLGLEVLRCPAGDGRGEARPAAPCHKGANAFEMPASNLPAIQGEQLSALQTGLRSLPDHVAATLVVLGERPPLDPKMVFQLLTAYARGAGELVMPLFGSAPCMPLLLGRRYWSEICTLSRPESLSCFLSRHRDDISFVDIDEGRILGDGERQRRARQLLPRSGMGDQLD